MPLSRSGGQLVSQTTELELDGPSRLPTNRRANVRWASQAPRPGQAAAAHQRDRPPRASDSKGSSR
ncbi:Hypothetical predicted protein [Olea europaea subsp. europaea]|uniref:Uncharacterized protein n=1 Tax=Olea europaea subsp. europaea TaxID=158383 RepID=A0A8S0TSI0_OLEEU|nr:Hypothetical predicted protein [Olea europaea subsp. europaea]